MPQPLQDKVDESDNYSSSSRDQFSESLRDLNDDDPKSSFRTLLPQIHQSEMPRLRIVDLEQDLSKGFSRLLVN